MAGLALAWVGLLLGSAAWWIRRVAPPRLDALGGEAIRRRQWLDSARPPAQVEAVGRWVRGQRGIRRGASRPEPEPDPVADARWGWGLVLAVAGLVLSGPVWATAGGLAGWWAPLVAERRRQRARHLAVSDDLPEVVDLLTLAAGAGLTPALAVEAVGRHGRGPIGLALARAHRQATGGSGLAEALDRLPIDLGDEVRPLVAVLVASQRYGAPLLPGLERLAAEVRLQRQRRAEAAAGRVPVRLLFPLVACILPAFALLTMAPLIAGALRGLRH